MNGSEVRKLIEAKLRERKGRIVAENAISAFCSLFPPANMIWQIVKGAKDKLDTERGIITLDVLLDMITAIDKKLNEGSLNATERGAFKIMLEEIKATGDVTGLRAKTSDPDLRKIFTDKEVKVTLRDITAGGNVTGVDLAVDRELQLKKKLEIETDFGSVKFNPDVGEITFGKGLNPDNEK